MKFIASLPEAKHYTPLRVDRKGVFLWEDKASSLIRVRAPERLIFKCFYPEEVFAKAKIIRTMHRAKFCHFYADQSPGLIGMYTIPVKDTWWLIYSIIEVY